MLEVNNKLLGKLNFIDLFSGIGGFHLALGSFGTECVFASELDKYAAESYQINFNIKPNGDITKIDEREIPVHDILCAGFPCQSFSISGKQKGFEDVRGTLFFDIVRIVNFHKPKVLILENVKNLTKHNGGQTLKTIIEVLGDLEYSVFIKVLNSSNFGLPQNRERVFIIAFSNKLNSESFNFPNPTNESICLSQILEDNPQNAKIIIRDDIEIYKEYDGIIQNKPIQIGRVSKGRQGERIYNIRGHAITLSAHGGGVGSKTGLYFINDKIRKLSPRECARVQGFPDNYIINCSDTQAYKQFGNSVSVNVLQHIILEIVKVLQINGLCNNE
jgi:DNA (cytosine-5)-methyltransferase 1